MDITEELRISEFMERLASADPTPGGGGASALVGAQAAALAEMAARITAGNPKYAAVTEEMETCAAKAATYRQKMLRLIGADAKAFAGLLAVWKRPRTDAARETMLREATAVATEIPLQLAEQAAATVALARRLLPQVTPSIRADADLAVLFGCAAVEGALHNVRLNMVDWPNDHQRTIWEERVQAVMRQVAIDVE